MAVRSTSANPDDQPRSLPTRQPAHPRGRTYHPIPRMSLLFKSSDFEGPTPRLGVNKGTIVYARVPWARALTSRVLESGVSRRLPDLSPHRAGTEAPSRGHVLVSAGSFWRLGNFERPRRPPAGRQCKEDGND